MSNGRDPQSSFLHCNIRGRWSGTERREERDGDKRGESERKERDGVREGRRNLTYFSLAYLYAEDNIVNQPEAWELA